MERSFDELLWIDMLKDRNETSHLYQIDLADEVLIRIPDYFKALQGAYGKLQSLLANYPN